MTRRSPLLSSVLFALLSIHAALLSTAVSAAGAVAAAAATDAAAAAAAASNVRYFVLIDAGSTGSRAHVHKYTVDSAKPLPIVHESQNKKIKPGQHDSRDSGALWTEPADRQQSSSSAGRANELAHQHAHRCASPRRRWFSLCLAVVCLRSELVRG